MALILLFLIPITEKYNITEEEKNKFQLTKLCKNMVVRVLLKLLKSTIAQHPNLKQATNSHGGYLTQIDMKLFWVIFKCGKN